MNIDSLLLFLAGAVVGFALGVRLPTGGPAPRVARSPAPRTEGVRPPRFVEIPPPGLVIHLVGRITPAELTALVERAARELLGPGRVSAPPARPAPRSSDAVG